jgi:D-glycero-D-manno-heptose 1,7-bisphosphate phosphatase
LKQVPVLYLDIDGTVRKGFDEIGRFVNSADDVDVFAEVPPLLATYKANGWRIVGCSNQGGIALGHVALEDVLGAMRKTQALVGDAFDRIAFCRHHPAAKDPEFARCWCRKPRMGLIFEAAYTLHGEHPDEMCPPHLALFVGDRSEDEDCAVAANIDFMSASDWRAGRHSPVAPGSTS